jgi:hypothetical protein
MPDYPIFPEFKPIELDDKDAFRSRLLDYQPETSELTFSNLFIWRAHYGFRWSIHGDYLLVIGHSQDQGSWALPPLGPPPRREIVRTLLHWLTQATGNADPRLERVDSRLVAELSGENGLAVEPTRDHFDYVYSCTDLIHLAGKHYHDKRNHLNSLKRSMPYTYEPLQEQHIPSCLKLAAQWCAFRRCEEDLNLMGEWEAIEEALKHFMTLEMQGGVILIEGEVEAFTLGELLNKDTAVVHIEKANPEIRGLYALINQQFCEQAWGKVPFINREQDLGEPGLRTAKLSYNPLRLAEKFRIRIVT